jgi:hypothetical protein
VQSLQTGDCLPMPSLRSSRPTGHDHYRNVRQSDPQIQRAIGQLGTDLRRRAPYRAERFSAMEAMEQHDVVKEEQAATCPRVEFVRFRQ